MHGVDWAAMRDRYGKLIDAVGDALGRQLRDRRVHRRAELVAHLSTAAATSSTAPSRGVGMLGVDWELADGAYRIKHIVRGGPWDADVRSPLDEPGVDVKEGDYVLAVNGVPLDTTKDPWASFEGLANKTVRADRQRLAVDDRRAAGRR